MLSVYKYRVGGVFHIGLARRGRRFVEYIWVPRKAFQCGPGFGLCVQRRGSWRNRWVFFGGPRLLGFVGW